MSGDAPETPPPPPPPPPLDDEGLPVGYRLRERWETTPREVKRAIDRGEVRADDERAVLLVDCRRPEEWETARIEGAVHIPMNAIPERLDELETEEGGRDRRIVVYCHHGVRSLKVTTMLQELGFANVRSMAGGIDLWSIDVDPGVPRY